MDKPRLIYIVQEEIDWHSSDAETKVLAYYSEKDAQEKVLKLIKQFKDLCKKENKPVVFERNGANGTFIENDCGDRYNVWIDTVILH